MPKEIKKPVDQIIPTVLDAVNDWKNKHTPEKIRSEVTRKLNASRDEIVLKLLGFDNRWSNSWELDHCNGRSGNSTAGDFLKQVQAEAVNTWLKEVCMPKITPTLKAKLQKEFQKSFEDRIVHYVRDAAITKAEKQAEEIINQVIGSDDIEKVLSLSKLIQS